jgi:uncharacterized protein involved in oxidation of intracellular sulfur
MKTLFILNDAPYGSERTYNGLRLAGAIAKQEGSEKLLAGHPNEVRVFMIGDGASAAHRNQKVPQGFYNIEVMIGNVIRHGGKVGICGTCMDARGLADSDLAEGTRRSTLAELADWTGWADKVLVF